MTMLDFGALSCRYAIRHFKSLPEEISPDQNGSVGDWSLAWERLRER